MRDDESEGEVPATPTIERLVSKALGGRVGMRSSPRRDPHRNDGLVGKSDANACRITLIWGNDANGSRRPLLGAPDLTAGEVRVYRVRDERAQSVAPSPASAPALA